MVTKWGGGRVFDRTLLDVVVVHLHFGFALSTEFRTPLVCVCGVEAGA